MEIFAPCFYKILISKVDPKLGQSVLGLQNLYDTTFCETS